MEKVQYFKCSDGVVFNDRAEAVNHETAIKMESSLTAFVDQTYTKNMTKEAYTKIISDNLTNLSEMREAARPKRKRRTKAELEAAQADETAPAPATPKKTKGKKK